MKIEDRVKFVEGNHELAQTLIKADDHILMEVYDYTIGQGSFRGLLVRFYDDKDRLDLLTENDSRRKLTVIVSMELWQCVNTTSNLCIMLENMIDLCESDDCPMVIFVGSEDDLSVIHSLIPQAKHNFQLDKSMEEERKLEAMRLAERGHKKRRKVKAQQ